ncbi:MAG TPA: glycosyltransferase family 2 protein [Thermomicrobiales bacterium]|nr:glycosyltransferase family 2 protein [Thermomicrobiales bacterium]
MPDLSVIVVSYNARAYLRRCLDDLAASAMADGVTLETIVVDNGSTDGSVEMLGAWEPTLVVVRNDANVGFAAANNQGLALARAPFALLLNSDAFIQSSVMRRALALLRERDRTGMVGVRLLNLDGSLQAEAGRFPTFWDDVRASIGLDRLGRRRDGAHSSHGPVDWVQGACMFVSMDAVRDVGGLDTRFFMYSEEVDWCRRFWNAGWSVWHEPGLAVTHVGGGSSQDYDTARRSALYRSRVGFRRVLDGPALSALLWLVIVTGLALRIPMRWAAQVVTRRPIGRQTPQSDFALLWAIVRTDPLARWTTSEVI